METDDRYQHGEAKKRPCSLNDRPTAGRQQGDVNDTHALKRDSFTPSLRGE